MLKKFHKNAISKTMNLNIHITFILYKKYFGFGSASTEFGYPNSGMLLRCYLSKHRLCVHTTLPQQATHLDIQMQPLVRHLLGPSRLPARSVLLPLAEVSAGHPHP